MTTSCYTIPLVIRRLGSTLVRENAVAGVTLEVKYCSISNYHPLAEDLRESIRQACGVTATLTPTSGGHFEVSVSGRLIFSKRANRRLPAADEILYHVEAALKVAGEVSSLPSGL